MVAFPVFKKNSVFCFLKENRINSKKNTKEDIGGRNMENLVTELLLMEKIEGINIEHLREMLLELSNTEKE